MTLGRARFSFRLRRSNFLLARLADGVVHQVPFVHHHDAGLALLHDPVGDLLVLLGDAALGVQHEDGDVAAGDGILGAFDAEELDRIVDAPGFAHAGGVDQHIGLPHALGFDLERHVHGVAGRAGNGADDHALGLGERVDDGGFADVGPADDGELQRTAGRRNRRDWRHRSQPDHLLQVAGLASHRAADAATAASISGSIPRREWR